MSDGGGKRRALRLACEREFPRAFGIRRFQRSWNCEGCFCLSPPQFSPVAQSCPTLCAPPAFLLWFLPTKTRSPLGNNLERIMRAWVGLFLSGHNKGALSVSRGRSPRRKGREDVAWVLCWETGASSCFDSPLCDGVLTSCINRAYCWSQEGTLNARGEEGSDAFLPPRCGIQEAVSPGRRWRVACGVRHGGASFWEKSSVPCCLLSLETTLWAESFLTFGNTGRECPSRASRGENMNPETSPSDPS